MPLTSTSTNHLLGTYPLPKGHHDELLAAPGVVRPHWSPLIDGLAQVPFVELNHRTEQAQRLLHENGLRYNPYSEPTSDGNTFTAETRPWSVNAVPLVLAPDEWRSLSAGLVQRALLLDALLTDLYGPQELLRRGLIPAEVLFSHPGFARCLHGQAPPGGRFLHFFAADLARFPDGQWRVIADRTDSPFGAGYALENRIVISRILPAIFQNASVERLAPFFLALRDTLRKLAPRHKDNPRIVILTQGPTGPSYFEDVYLAGYLAYPLVESGDLAVRDNQVFLKTLAGLVPVDVIFRRQSDLHCDPLELKGDVTLGVSGLLQATRGGQVVVVNALGSSLTEAPAFWPLLPRLCRELRGEDLLLPALETHWLGDPESRRLFFADPSRFVLRSAYRFARQEPHPRERLQRLTGEQQRALIEAQPSRFVVQEPTHRSTAPAWTGRGLRATHFALRVYLVASQDSYLVMPGGLVRASDDPTALDLSILAGETSKDAWVLSEGPVRVVSLLQQPGQAVTLKRTGAELPSRVADNMHWLGRHVERAECLVRLLRPLLVRLTGESGGLSGRGGNGRFDLSDAERLPELSFLLRALADHGQLEPGFVVEGMRQQLPAVSQVLPSAVLDESQPHSLRAIVSAMGRAAGLVRDRLSADCWRTVMRLDRDLLKLGRQSRVELHELLAGLNGMLIDLAAFAGLVQENTTRTQGWRFLDLGRRIERAQHTASLVRAALVRLPEGDPADHGIGPVLEAVLEVVDSLMTYRSRYLGLLQVAPVLDLVLTDETNPRSLAYQLAVLSEHIEHMPREATQATRGLEQRLAVSILNSLRLSDVQRLSQVELGERRRLDKLLARLTVRLPRLAELISRKYLIHAGIPRTL